ncbi:MoxR family ATPase [Ferruginibacter sp. HRS2-29]|uniref:AAA family ATPase n=1 Tax=Ferruginibacter sp. HRS2-29 TaxID=2487334 RepID=UPI0020CE2D47|nr:MoxR family ATPase [Ferruginibacter sp. HRS2-29]MCP9752491.1 MoxR family ATPase [Ferruginibacter sp. HRS2-29]
MEENTFAENTPVPESAPAPVPPSPLTELNAKVYQIRNEIGKVIIGQHQVVDLLLIGLLCDGHLLLEGVPGVAKTLAAKLLSKIIDVDFSRLQFTPDLMPGDVIGTSVFNPKEGAFYFRSGPIFSNIVLIDEINRAPAKTQSALFEVMEERQVTVDGDTHVMRYPFIVLATQNPIEQEGTYRLPEAQLDRFLFKIEIGYPSLQEEVNILTSQQGKTQNELLQNISKLLSPADLKNYRQLVQEVIVDAKIIEYIARIINETRNNPSLYLGASTRASLALLKSSKACAAIKGRNFVIPDDVIEMAAPVLRHRIMLTPEKEMEGIDTDDLIQSIIKAMEIPR